MLSKSKFIRGLQCPKSLWLDKYRPELRDVASASQQARFDTGNKVGDLACQLYPGGVEVAFNKNNYDGMVEQTQHLIAEGCKVIYEATFIEHGVLVMADIMVKNGDAWDVYEVKSSSKVSETYIDDASIQWHVLSNALSVNRIAIIHINSDYEFDGAFLDIHQLFKIVDITEEVLLKQQSISQQIEVFESLLAEEAQPDVSIGQQCERPNTCDFKRYCWKDVPSPSVLDLYRMRLKDRFELYHSGVKTFQDISPDINLNRIQQVQVASSLSGALYIQPDVINDYVNSLSYPIYFFDFETFMPSIPSFKGQRPFQQIPFQYSLHILHEDGELEHREYLSEVGVDPRPGLVDKMLEDLGGQGSIVAFNQSFEISRIQSLAAVFNDQSQALLNLIPRFSDLMQPFRALGYYDPKMNGSFSIKSILPALFPDDPELDYNNLVIKDGGMAMSGYEQLQLMSDPNDLQALRQALLDYCCLDTLAMVKIYLKLSAIAKPN